MLLTEQERYWACYIRRKAEDKGWVEKGTLKLNTSLRASWAWYPKLNDEENVHECLFMALTHPDPITAFRAYTSHTAQNEELVRSCNLTDAKLTARHRIERFLTYTLESTSYAMDVAVKTKETSV